MNRKIDWTHVQARIEPWLQGNRRVGLTAAGFAGVVILIRLLGILETFELAALDQLFQIRRGEKQDDRIVLVYIDDDDISSLDSWPISDGVMATALENIKAHSPRAIGLDIYRDLPVGEGQEQLNEVFETTPNLIGIEKRTDQYVAGVRPPEILKQNNQIGFNDVLLDSDGRVRRSLLFARDNEEHHTSFALKLAELYLAEDGITAHGAERGNPAYLQLGDAIFSPLNPNDGGYVRTDNGGYQIIANFRSNPTPFKTISFSDVLNGEIPVGLMNDRIVLIGSSAKSLQDYFSTPLSGRYQIDRRMPGVKLHAHFISQIISAAVDGRTLIHVWPEPVEWIWIIVWSVAGASLSWRVRSPLKVGPLLLLTTVSLGAVSYLAFLGGWWIPVVPSMIALIGSAIGITGYIAYLEGELQKSKEFLNSVINTIPDPIFVKDSQYRWIVLNEAYCRFIGHPIEELIGKNEREFLPPHQAHALQLQDEAAFFDEMEAESEDEFTSPIGHTYVISTKRSLHKDSAGNRFLVGVIHDITQRKRMEDELRRTAAELVQSNAELRQTGARFREMAYHDPLTGLPNRKLFQERLIQSIEWAEYNDQLIALLFIDLDGFKLINDTKGHVIGDLLLKAVAKRLSGSLRSSDTVARLGGDEFVVLLPAIPSKQKTGQVAQKLLSTLSETFVLQDETIFVTASIGISMYPFDGDSLESLIVEADQAMYRAKSEGKNQFRFASGSSTQQIMARPVQNENGPTVDVSISERIKA
ncbi:MAG: CHASE2 domain-containing protein [Leptolyngbyaceae bacterium]|nr:CHASE2 domain-containing protein [Leptolyngbyaceae bacterium]